MNRHMLITLAAAASIAFTVSACGGGGSSSSSTTSTETAKPSVTTVPIVVSNGKVDGGLKTTTVKKGEKVALVVTSDVADEVHVHGYDKHIDVTPGTPARLAFVASIPGRFEVELEERGLQIADLEVRP